MTPHYELTLSAPLFCAWSEQYVRLYVPGAEPGVALELLLDGAPHPFQFTGEAEPRGSAQRGAQVLVRLGFEKGQTRRLEWRAAATGATGLAPVPIPLEDGATIGAAGRELVVPAPRAAEVEGEQNGPRSVAGPFGAFAGFPFRSRIVCEAAFVGASLHRTNDGPLFREYELGYEFANERRYRLRLRFFHDEPIVEVREEYSLGHGARLEWTLNPERAFDSILSRDSFEGETQPNVEPLGEAHPRDVLCRLQMPVLSEYYIPNNRGWFAFFDSKNAGRGMMGVLGLHGASWREPVAGMPVLYDRASTVEWQASLASGARFWMLYAGPLETEYSLEKRLVFHRLHAQWNALRLDEHLDLTGGQLWDENAQGNAGLFEAGDFRAAVQQRCKNLIPLRKKAMAANDNWLYDLTFAALREPSPELHAQLHIVLVQQFERWVRQFSGWREGSDDYFKNVIGFSRLLRAMLIAYELLCRDGALDVAQRGRLNAYFAFAARRITDEGRWPHSKTWLHPDHPESVRDLYTYGGEHKPDKLVWSNSLPNFQSDALCALAHLAALFPEHPDSARWLRFALDEVERALDAYGGPTGAWEESINYALFIFSYFVTTFRVVKNRTGLNYFQDERMRRYAGWLCRFFGPYDKRFGVATWPPIGNARLPQIEAHYLLAYAGELDEDDPLRHECIAVYQQVESHIELKEEYPAVLAAMAPLAMQPATAPPRHSEVMAEVGVAMRHRGAQSDESYLFQKIGFAKDHYEADETAFHWLAKGTPLSCDYGTYTPDVAIGAAHNVVDIPDLDALRRGYLANHFFSPALDYTHCEQPVTLKLMWDKVRSWEEVDNADGIIKREKTPYFYIGDPNPVGPKTWKTRLLLWIKPDYIALFDRVYGEVPHRFCLHAVGAPWSQNGARFSSSGRFDLDMELFVQHPAGFGVQTGELVPNYGATSMRAAHAQHWLRLYNQSDGIYRTLLFARERDREVQISSCGAHGFHVQTPEYEDFLFLHNDVMSDSDAESGAAFEGRVGWIRREAGGEVRAALLDGDRMEAFGHRFSGRGAWTWNIETSGGFYSPNPARTRNLKHHEAGA